MGFLRKEIVKMLTGKEGGIKPCTCANGHSWDTTKKECVVSSGTQPPIPPVVTPVPGVPSTAAPAVSTGPVTSSAPMTTPSATQSMVMSILLRFLPLLVYNLV
jgi:hypothetical protein